MKVIYKPAALKAIGEAVEYIEAKNTEGSGLRWAEKLATYILSFAKPNTTYAICRHKSLSRYNYQCITYNDWVIAFKIQKDVFEVRRVIYGANLH